MHYYQFNIGDYASHTSRLSPMEDLAYRRLLDLYYLNEHPLNGCSTDVAREIGLVEHVTAVEYVLSKFFTFENDCYKQKRIDIEIKKYKSNHKNKKKAGIASAKARQAKAKNEVTDVEQVLNTSSTDEQQNINQEPLTKNQKPVIKDPLSCKPDCVDVINHMNSVLGTKYKTSTKSHIQNISARLSDGHSVDDLKNVIDSKSKEWGGDPKMAQYLRPQTLFGASKFQGYLTASKTIGTGQHRNINDIGKDFSPPPGFTPMKFDDNGNVIS